MMERRTFRIVMRPQKATEPESHRVPEPDTTMEYDGKAASVHIRNQNVSAHWTGSLKELAVKAISRRNFVAAAAVAGAGAVLRRPTFAFENRHPTVSFSAAKPMGHEVVAPQVSPFPVNSVRLGPGVFNQAAEANRKYLKTVQQDRPVAAYLPLECRPAIFRGTAGRVGEA